MRASFRLVASVLATTAMLSVAATAATASSSIAVSGGESVTATATAVTFREEGEGEGGGSIICEVTLNLGFHREFAKTEGELIGVVSGGRINEEFCRSSSGLVTVRARFALAELFPWHLQYAFFEGTLPNITSITFDIVRFNVLLRYSLLGGRAAECLYLDELRARASGSRANELDRMTLEEGAPLMLWTVLERRLKECASGMAVRGTFRFNRVVRLTLVA